MDTQFKIGDNAVYLSYGVGVIKGIERREFSPEKVSEFYILEIQDHGAPKKCFISLASANEKLRPVIKQDQVNQIFSVLSDPNTTIDDFTWNRCFRDYMEKINSGILVEVAEVVKSLSQLKSDKNLSFGEHKLLEQTRTLLIKELSLAMNETEENVAIKIQSLLNPKPILSLVK